MKFSNHYKLQKRERPVDIQALAEENYERYLDQEEEYMREVINKCYQQLFGKGMCLGTSVLALLPYNSFS